jgi:hypothetical protein
MKELRFDADDGVGGSRSRSTRDERRSCSWQATNPA